MAILDFLKAPKKAPPHAQISELEERLQRVVAERRTLEALVESHSAKRAAMVYEADKSEEDIIAFDREIDLARLRLERAELVEIELTERIGTARDSSERQRRAGEYERAAEAIASKTQAIDQAAAAFGAAYRDMLTTIPEGTELKARKPRFLGDVPATPEDIAGAIIAQALAAHCPQIFENRPATMRSYGASIEKILTVRDLDSQGRLSPVLAGERGEEATISSAEKAAERFVVGPLRDKARALRDSADLAQAAE